MHQPAIQAALNNLVEAIRTALMAEFVEYSRGGDRAPTSAKRKPARAKKSTKSAPRRKVAKKTPARRSAR